LPPASTLLPLYYYYVATTLLLLYSDPPDVSIISHRARRQRKRKAAYSLMFELLFTVVTHPFPGLKETIFVQALSRRSEYEFEAIISIFMFGRAWHVWQLIKHDLFHRYYISTTYLLGNSNAILGMLRRWEHFDNVACYQDDRRHD
jgi:hypothetical protein